MAKRVWGQKPLWNAASRRKRWLPDRANPLMRSTRGNTMIKWMAVEARVGSRLAVIGKRRFTQGDWHVKAFVAQYGGGDPGRHCRRGPSGGEGRKNQNADHRRGQVVHGSNRLALQRFLCLRQWRLRESADPRRIRRLWREPGNRRTQLRHPQGNPRKFGSDRRTQGQRGPARRRLLRIRHGRGRDRPRRIAAARRRG